MADAVPDAVSDVARAQAPARTLPANGHAGAAGTAAAQSAATAAGAGARAATPAPPTAPGDRPAPPARSAPANAAADLVDHAPRRMAEGEAPAQARDPGTAARGAGSRVTPGLPAPAFPTAAVRASGAVTEGRPLTDPRHTAADPAEGMLASDPHLLALLPHTPWTAAGLESRATEISGGIRREPAALRRFGEAVRGEMAARGADGRGLAAAAALSRGQALAVVALLPARPLLGTTGDVLAALGAVALAREAAAALGQPCVPVLLVAPRGADGGSLYLLDRPGALVRLAAGPAGGRREAASLLDAAEHVTGVRWPLARATLPAEDAAVYREWNARIATALFAPLGAVVARSDGPACAEAFGPRYIHLLAWGATLRAALGAAAAEIRGAGYAPPLPAPVATAFFGWRTQGRAHPLRLHEGMPVAPDGRVLQPAELARLGRERPQALAPERLGLYMLLNDLLPLLGVIVGHDDLGLLLQASRALPHLGRGMPLVRPRPRLTLVSPAAAAFGRSHEVTLDAGPEALQQARDRELAALSGFDAAQEAAQLEAATARAWAAFAERAARAAPGLAPRIAAERQRWSGRAGRLADDVAVNQRRQQRGLAAAWRHVLNDLYPLGGAQDEVRAAMPALAGDVERLFARVLAEPPAPVRRFIRTG